MMFINPWFIIGWIVLFGILGALGYFLYQLLKPPKYFRFDIEFPTWSWEKKKENEDGHTDT